jgi:hypothetical protein
MERCLLSLVVLQVELNVRVRYLSNMLLSINGIKMGGLLTFLVLAIQGAFAAPTEPKYKNCEETTTIDATYNFGTFSAAFQGRVTPEVGGCNLLLQTEGETVGNGQECIERFLIAKLLSLSCLSTILTICGQNLVTSEVGRHGNAC